MGSTNEIKDIKTATPNGHSGPIVEPTENGRVSHVPNSPRHLDTSPHSPHSPRSPRSPRSIKSPGFEDDACSEIVRIEEEHDQETTFYQSAFGKLVQTIQVGREFIRTWASGKQKEGPESRPDSFLERFAMGGHIDEEGRNVRVRKASDLRNFRTWVVDPSQPFYYRWLFAISAAVMYNLVFVIVRSVFTELQDEYLPLWLVLDYLCDFMYVIDMTIQFRTGKSSDLVSNVGH